MSRLSLAQRQIVEIAKALSLNARLVILDEPTSSLPIAETEKLLKVIAALKANGIAVMFVSHRLNEVVEACDRVIVLRDGRIVGHLEGDAMTHDAMVKLMVGRDLKVAYAAPASERGDVVLSVQKLRTTTFPFAEVSIDFHRGEILGLAGLVGAGRTELAHALFGIDATEGGTVLLDGAPVRFASSADAVKAGVFLVPEDRKGMGLVLDLSITENITLPNLSAYARGLTISREAERARAEKSRGELDIRAPNLAARTGSLSGGNQQKVVLAKWLAMNPRVIIFDEPTRGIDIGAKSEIYRLMRTLADAGVAVLMISSDMEEVIGVSDRVAVMHQGRISGILAARAMQRREHLAARGRKPRGGSREPGGKHSNAEEGPRAPRPHPRDRHGGRADQPAFPVGHKHLKYGQPGRPVRHVLDRAGLRHHHRRHRTVGRVHDRASGRDFR